MSAKNVIDLISFEQNMPKTEQIMTFSLGASMFGLSILRVQEIRTFCPMTLIPNSPPGVVGMMNLRGAIIPVIDACQILGLGRGNLDEVSVIMIINVNPINEESQGIKTAGLVVDQVREAQSIFVDQLQPVPKDFKSRVPAEALAGLIEIDGKMATVLELDNLLAREIF